MLANCAAGPHLTFVYDFNPFWIPFAYHWATCGENLGVVVALDGGIYKLLVRYFVGAALEPISVTVGLHVKVRSFCLSRWGYITVYGGSFGICLVEGRT